MPASSTDSSTPPLEVVNDGTGPLSRIMPPLITPKGSWFAWGFIAGILFTTAAIYVVKKKM